MSDGQHSGHEGQDVPKGQHFFDNLLWLFLLSLVLSLVIYNAWGLIELMNVPPVP
jgi:hypothetical protein